MRHEGVGDAAAALGGEPPAARAAGRGGAQLAAQARDLDLAQRAEVPVVDQFLERAHRRDVAELESHRGHRAVHLLGLRDGERERLFAQHVLAGGQRGEHRRVVVERRRSDRDDVELDAGQHLADRPERVRDLALARDALGARRRRDRDHLEARMQRIGRRVHRAPEA